MTCDPWLELISAATDGELDDAEQDALDAHLARCASCRALATRFGALRRRSLIGLPEAIPDLAPLVVARHQADRAAEPHAGAPRRDRRGALAAAVVLVVGVLATSEPFDTTRARARDGRHLDPTGHRRRPGLQRPGPRRADG